MSELADIFRQFGPAYRDKHSEHLLPSHLAVMRAIEACRTEALGGQVYHCATCDETWYCYHSCKNRHCPKCQQQAAQVWLEQQQSLLLPVPYFLVTFTLPASLRDVARRKQKLVYNLFFRASAVALQALARDPRFVGGQIGCMGVLQTWTRDLRYHPHIHYLVPGGGLAADGQRWLASDRKFLVRVEPLARLFRGKMRAGLRKAGLLAQVPPAAWRQDWVVDCRSVGRGQTALKYLAPYIFRVALSNKRIVSVHDGKVTFAYREGETGRRRLRIVTAEEFIRLFLQHVLPKGFVKVRYYGLLAPGNRHWLRQAQALLGVPCQSALSCAAAKQDEERETQAHVVLCPRCGQPLQLVQSIRPVMQQPALTAQGCSP
jgi:hypothetical protein